MKKLVLLVLMAPALACAQVYPFFPPPGMTYTGSQWGPLSSMPSVATSTIVGNNSGSTGAPSALNPLAAANLMAAQISVDVVASANITLSGPQTIDSISVGSGQTVLVTAQSTASQNGIYVSAAGAWARAAWFPAGYVVPQQCDLIVKSRQGTLLGGKTYYLATSAGALTIGTSSLTFTEIANPATTTSYGQVKVSSIATVASLGSFAGATTRDCVSTADTHGTIQDTGDANGTQGPCAVENNSTGHLVLNTGNNSPGGNYGSPTSSAGTINGNSTDHWGFITGLSGATTVTLTFFAAYPNQPACTANDNAGTAVGVSTASGGTTATFTMSALTGTLYYVCFGTN